mmetsp:Transcript_50707/g.158419  ORF Transcript_50707/g.158419 Transcript_50707/m.158419 type:complete len:251 (-) Transcript_50707:99-851(-)
MPGGKGKSTSMEIDPKVWHATDFRSEYTMRIADQAPRFYYRRFTPPDKNKSHSLVEGGPSFPPSQQFQTSYSQSWKPDGTAGQPGFSRREIFKIGGTQTQFGDNNSLTFKEPFSHTVFTECDLRSVNVRNLRRDGIKPAGLKSTTLPYYNIIPGVGNEDPSRGRCVFDAFQETSNKFRDTRRFAQLNNPRIPRGHQLNPLTGEVPPSPLLLPLPDDPQLLPTRRPPPVDLFPQSRKKPPLSSLAQVRPAD